MAWTTSASQAVAHTLHVAALAGFFGPGYARRDASLRKSPLNKRAIAELKPESLTQALRSALQDGQSPWREHDTDWFLERWQLGEGAALHTQSNTLVEGLVTLDLNELFDTTIHVQASTAVGGSPLAISSPALVVAQPSSSVKAIVVVALGAQVETVMPSSPLSDEDRRWQSQFIAASMIRHHLGELCFTNWLKPLLAHFVGRFTHTSALIQRVETIANATLDQPPGEIERIGLGLARGLESRLDRALRRAFFTPSDDAMQRWIDLRLRASKDPQAD